MELGRLEIGELVLGMDPCPPEDLVREHIADPRDHLLIHEEALQVPTTAVETAAELIFAEVERIWTEGAGDARDLVATLREPQPTKLSLVLIDEVPVVDAEDDAREPFLIGKGRLPGESASHPEVEDERGAGGGDEEPLASPFRCADAPSLQTPGELLRAHASDHAGVEHRDAKDHFVTRMVLEDHLESLDVRQLRHGNDLPTRLHAHSG